MFQNIRNQTRDRKASANLEVLSLGLVLGSLGEDAGCMWRLADCGINWTSRTAHLVRPMIGLLSEAGQTLRGENWMMFNWLARVTVYAKFNNVTDTMQRHLLGLSRVYALKFKSQLHSPPATQRTATIRDKPSRASENDWLALKGRSKGHPKKLTNEMYTQRDVWPILRRSSLTRQAAWRDALY